MSICEQIIGSKAKYVNKGNDMAKEWQRKNSKGQAIKNYSEANREVKRSAPAMRVNYSLGTVQQIWLR